MENLKANSLRKRTSMALFTSLSSFPKWRGGSIFFPLCGGERLSESRERVFRGAVWGSGERERKEDLAFLFTVDDACFTREEGTVCGELHLSLILGGFCTDVS